MGDRIQLKVELGFRGDIPEESAWEGFREAGIAWLQKAQPNVEPAGSAYLSSDVDGCPILAFGFECDKENYFVGSRLLFAVRKAFPEAGVSSVAITQA